MRQRPVMHLAKMVLTCILLCLWMGFVYPGSGDASPQSPSPSLEIPLLEMPETSHDFGDVSDGEELTHDFLVRNIGMGNLEITRVLTS